MPIRQCHDSFTLNDTNRREEDGLPLDAIVIGAGFAGIYALHKLRELGFRAKAFEAGAGVGGTWYWNRYPGARCDVQSQAYSYTFDERFQHEWTWSERYATRDEIKRYLDYVTDRLELRPHMVFNARIVAATFDDASHRWTVVTRGGERVSATYLLMATGALSAGRLPDISGVGSFQGACHHTGDWPIDGVEVAGKRVGVIGTGSSGVQAIPVIATEARALTVFQRTPAFVAPARNTLLTNEEVASFRARFRQIRDGLRHGRLVGAGDIIIGDHLPPTQPSALQIPEEERRTLMEARWQVGGMSIAGAFADILTNLDNNGVVADFFRRKIREIVHDPKTAEILTPRGFPIFSKRLCIGTNYYETYNRENVTLVDLKASPVEEITATGVRTSAQHYPLDVLIFATGFDALTGALVRIDIRGREGRSLREEWAGGPRSCLGIAMSGFPNLFTLNGPGSPGILTNNVVGIEHHVEWLADLLTHARQHGRDLIEPDLDAQHRWTDHVTQAAVGNVLAHGNGWYLKDVAPGKPKVFVPYVKGIAVYREICDRIASEGYRGFVLR